MTMAIMMIMRLIMRMPMIKKDSGNDTMLVIHIIMLLLMVKYSLTIRNTIHLISAPI